jgi:hypothetical protein
MMAPLHAEIIGSICFPRSRNERNPPALVVRSLSGGTEKAKTMTDQTPMKINNSVPAVANEVENIAIAANEDAGFSKLLKFNHGDYLLGSETVPLGTEYIAHPEAWVKAWIKFVDDKVAERKLYRVARGEKPPERDELDDTDSSVWPSGDKDPWSLQYLLPLEDSVSGTITVFTTSSVGGRIAVGQLCSAWAQRVKRGYHGQPRVELQVGALKSKKFGEVPAPELKIIGWTDATGDASTQAPPAKGDFQDEIPF